MDSLLNELISLGETVLRWAVVPVLLYTVYLIARELLKGNLKEAFLKGAIGVGAAVFLFWGPGLLFGAFDAVENTVEENISINDVTTVE